MAKHALEVVSDSVLHVADVTPRSTPNTVCHVQRLVSERSAGTLRMGRATQLQDVVFSNTGAKNQELLMPVLSFLLG